MLSDQVQYSVVDSTTSNQARSKVLEAGNTVNNNSRISNCPCSLFSKKNPIIRIFCICGWLAIPFNPDKWRTTVIYTRKIISHKSLITGAVIGQMLTFDSALVLECRSGTFSEFVTKIFAVPTPLFFLQCDKVTVYDRNYRRANEL